MSDAAKFLAYRIASNPAVQTVAVYELVRNPITRKFGLEILRAITYRTLLFNYGLAKDITRITSSYVQRNILSSATQARNAILSPGGAFVAVGAVGPFVRNLGFEMAWDQTFDGQVDPRELYDIREDPAKAIGSRLRIQMW